MRQDPFLWPSGRTRDLRAHHRRMERTLGRQTRRHWALARRNPRFRAALRLATGIEPCLPLGLTTSTMPPSSAAPGNPEREAFLSSHWRSSSETIAGSARRLFLSALIIASPFWIVALALSPRFRSPLLPNA